jgi:hypothetical protein
MIDNLCLIRTTVRALLSILKPEQKIPNCAVAGGTYDRELFIVLFHGSPPIRVHILSIESQMLGQQKPAMETKLLLRYTTNWD